MGKATKTQVDGLRQHVWDPLFKQYWPEKFLPVTNHYTWNAATSNRQNRSAGSSLDYDEHRLSNARTAKHKAKRIIRAHFGVVRMWSITFEKPVSDIREADIHFQRLIRRLRSWSYLAKHGEWVGLDCWKCRHCGDDVPAMTAAKFKRHLTMRHGLTPYYYAGAGLLTRKRKEQFHYIAVREFQKERGKKYGIAAPVHYHMIIDRFVPIWEMKRMWGAGSVQIETDHKSGKGKTWAAKDEYRKLSSYLDKYIAKALSDPEDAARLKGHHLYMVSHWLSKIPEFDALLTPEDYARLIGAVHILHVVTWEREMTGGAKVKYSRLDTA